MQLTLQSAKTIVQNAAAATQGACAKILNLNVGSGILAILEGSASVMLWLQAQALLVLQATRLSSSQGTDVDTYVADFGLTRAPAVTATGAVTFARLSPTYAALITPYVVTTNSDGSTTATGTTIKTIDGTISFGVLADPTNAAWNAMLGGFVVPIGTASVTVQVQALVAGSSGNVGAGTIGLISSAISGIDTVTNALPFTNGLDPQSDPSVRQQFINFLASRARATLAAIEYAINLVQQGLFYQIVENVALDGSYSPGNFVVYLDDGTGNPPSALRDAVYESVDAYRAIGTTIEVQGPTVVNASIVMTVMALPGYTSANLVGPVASAVTAYVDTVPMGSPALYSRLAQVAYDSTPGIANVSAITLNGAAADIGGGVGQVVRVSSLTVNPG